ncbi:MarC family protein [Metallosphaera yellowstonensis]|nr:MarC family protein [Metallosphaera yellowstonensis]
MMSLESVLIIAVKVFAVMDPFSIIPYILSIFEEATQGDEKMRWTALVNKVEVAVIILVLIFSLMGRPLLNFLGLQPYSLEIGGGILLLYLGIDTLGGFQQLKFVSKRLEEAVVTPIATPLIVGPGTMTALISLSVQNSVIDLVLGSLVAAFLTYLVLLSGPLLIKVLGRTGTVAAGRFTAIIIAAFGVQLIISGISQVKLA